MNIEQAKTIPLEQFLAKLGFEPTRNQRGQLWYLSPFRQEKTPSFKVNTGLNLWYDFGTGDGGTIIDLAISYGKKASIPEALKLIESTMQGAVHSFEPRLPLAQNEPPHRPEIHYVGALKNLDLKRYLRQRGIDPRKCSQEIQEVHYATDSKPYVAIGFASDRDGYEVRNRSFKGSLGPKGISVREGQDLRSAIVFEGFFDYLTYLTLWGRPSAKVIVLNSVGLREQAVEYLRSQQVARIELFRDNDAAGEALIAYFREQLPQIEIIDQAPHRYPQNKDLNEWHQAGWQRTQRHSIG